jgi:hypothetical protein
MTIIVNFDAKIAVSDLSAHMTPSCYATPIVGYKEPLMDSVV